MSLPSPESFVASTARPARPSSHILAFAIAVIRSKPLELSIGEYIRFLRQHIARGRRQDAISATHRHLDRSSYWRSEYERTKDALTRAQDESISLRLEVESLKDKRDVARPGTANKKRKKADEDVIPYPRSPKRSKGGCSPTRSVPTSKPALLENLTHVEFREAGEIGTILLRSVYHVHAILKHGGKDQISDLAYHITCATSAVPQIIDQEVRKFGDEQSPDLEFFRNTLTVAGRAIKFVYAAFTKLAKNRGNGGALGKVTYDIVRMFKDLAIKISVLSEYEMKRAISAELAEASNKKAPTTKPKAKAHKFPTVKENAFLAIYTAFLARLIEIVDSKVEANKSLFEGMAYCVLDKLGQRLFTTVFGHQRGTDLDAEIHRSNLDDDIEEDDAAEVLQPANLVVRQAKLEAPYLIHLLKRMMVAAPTHLGLAIDNKTGKPKRVSGKGAVKGALAITAKECLQRTLVHCIFGAEGVDENDPFVDCLKMPILGNGAFPMPKIKEADTQEWFKEEVWRLLGWDILEREIEQPISH